MCGKGMVCQWGPLHRQACKGEIQADERRKDAPRWYKCGKQQGWRGRRGRARGYPEPRRLNQWRGARPSDTVLRPVNIKGNRAPGMRAPRNTNQFLMHEKYQMMHMRSDSVGTDSGSDCEMDFADMDSYLGVLENARGALMDSLELSPPPLGLFCPPQLVKCDAFAFDFAVLDQEESLPYFPSEDDANQTEDFMQRDFNEFCDTIGPPE